MKKRILALIMAVITVFSVMSILAVAKTVVAGDVTGDGKVTASDARKALRVSAGLESFDDTQFLVADINSDGKITASDARKILRKAAGLEELPEITTQESATEEISSEEITTEEVATEEVSTEDAVTDENTTEEPSSEEVATQEPESDTSESETEEVVTQESTTVVVTELPEDIAAFFDGKYYMECDMSSDGDESTIKLAQKDKKFEASMLMDGFELSIYTDGKKIFIKFPYEGKVYYLEMGKEFLEENGIELDVELLASQLSFGTLEDYNAPVLLTEEFEGQMYDVYKFVDKDGFSLSFYMDSRNDVKYIISNDKEGNTETIVEVAVLSATIPSDMLNVKSCKKGSLVTLMYALETFEQQMGE